MNNACLKEDSKEYLKTLILLSLTAVFYLGNHLVVYGQSINSIIYELYYSPIENIGILVVNITVFSEDCGFYDAYINIFGDNGVYEFQYYNTSNGLIVAGFNYSNGSAEFLACGEGVISLYYTLENVVTESSFTTYELQIDTSIYRYSGIPVEARVYLDGDYKIVVTRVEDMVVNSDEENGLITVSGYGVVIVSLLMEIEEPVITETSPVSSTTTPIMTFVSTSISTTALTTPTEILITNYPGTTEMYSTRVTPVTTTTSMVESTSTPHGSYTHVGIGQAPAILVIGLFLLITITTLIVLITKRKQ